MAGSPQTDSIGRYELLLELAKGGMAELYLGRLHGVGGFAKLVAIKRILPHLAEDKRFVELFLNEGRIAAHLSHPNVCQVYELGEADGDLFLAMEYLDGVSWDALIQQMPRDVETLRLAAGVIAQTCEGLHYAHELRDVEGNPTPVIHRDVSPQNLFVTVDGICKVLDFGVSKMVKDGPRTRTGVLKGKLPYMAPEQIQGETVDARSDVFALGVVMWEALSGVSLFDRETDFLIWKAVAEAPIPLLAPHGFPMEIDAVLGAALAREREHRFCSAHALGEALRNAADKVGGAYTPAEIAAAVKTRCGDKLAERARAIASVVTSRRSQPPEPTAADTIEEKAGSTVRLRPDPVKIERSARRRRWPVIAVAVAAVAALAAVIVIARGDDDPTTTAKTDDTETANAAESAAPSTSAPATEGLDETLANANKDVAQAIAVLDQLAGTPPAEPESESLGQSVDRLTQGLGRLRGRVRVGSEPGRFSIDSTPQATIFLDGTELANTPVSKLKVRAGRHRVRAVLADGREKTFSVDVPAATDVSAGNLTW